MDLATLEWQRSGTGDGALEVAFVRGPSPSAGPGHGYGAGPGPGYGAGPGPGYGAGSGCGPGAGAPAHGVREDVIQWVLLRVAGDPAGRILVYDRTEWLSFVDGAASGEFDFAAE